MGSLQTGAATEAVEPSVSCILGGVLISRDAQIESVYDLCLLYTVSQICGVA